MEDLNSLKVVELKERLKEKGLPIAGSKQELLKRLKSAMELEETADLEETEEVVEQVVLQEEEEEDDDEDTNDADFTLSDSKTEEPTKTEKTTVKLTSPPKDSVENFKPEKITLSGLSEAEVVDDEEARLKKRAEKFGAISADAKKQLRAERFGLSEKNSNTTAAKSIGSATVDTDKLKQRAERFGIVAPTLSKAAEVDKLKQRAERFGSSVAPVLSKSEEQEKILKRKQRFGAISSGAITGDQDAKKQKRAERFGLT